jgi:UDP:flavonoid glycosyltransferase YjiC (YdhE family)
MIEERKLNHSSTSITSVPFCFAQNRNMPGIPSSSSSVVVVVVTDKMIMAMERLRVCLDRNMEQLRVWARQGVRVTTELGGRCAQLLQAAPLKL